MHLDTPDSSTNSAQAQSTDSVLEQPLVTMLSRRLSRLPRAYVMAGAALVVLLIIGSSPAAAQEFCDDPAGQLLISIETMLINYGTMLLFLAFLIGIAMWALTPIFAGQSAIGLGMVLLAFGAAIAFVVGTQFFGMTFEIAGAGGESCSTVLD